jgi:hypothetical protein
MSWWWLGWPFYLIAAIYLIGLATEFVSVLAVMLMGKFHK